MFGYALMPWNLLPIITVDAYTLAIVIKGAAFSVARRVCGRFRGASGLDSAVSDLQCITWMLQTSLDKFTHLSILKLLSTMTTPSNFNTALVSACFSVLTSCMSVVDGKMVINQGSKELAEVSALYCLRALFRLVTTDPALGALKDVRQRYIRTFPFETNFEGLPSGHSFGAIHGVFHSPQPRIQWKDCQLPSDDHAALARSLTELVDDRISDPAQRRSSSKKVPRWILRFALHHLSQDPPPPTPIVINCLLIIAVDLGCTALNTTALDERYVHIWQIFTFLTKS